jgi:hypothetical protein
MSAKEETQMRQSILFGSILFKFMPFEVLWLPLNLLLFRAQNTARQKLRTKNTIQLGIQSSI